MAPRPSARAAAAGFTLLELAIALAILAILAIPYGNVFGP